MAENSGSLAENFRSAWRSKLRQKFWERAWLHLPQCGYAPVWRYGWQEAAYDTDAPVSSFENVIEILRDSTRAPDAKYVQRPQPGPYNTMCILSALHLLELLSRPHPSPRSSLNSLRFEDSFGAKFSVKAIRNLLLELQLCQALFFIRIPPIAS